MITPAFGLTATERVLPKFALDFTTGVLDARVSVARALNTSTCVNSSGYIETVNANLPRFNYDPVTKVPQGLLIEAGTSNQLTYSSNFSTLPWYIARILAFGSGSVVDATTSPAGIQDADKLVESTAASNTHLLFQYPVNLSGKVVFSVFAKPVGRNWIFLRAGADYGVFFDIANGAVGANTGATGRIENYGNGWYRCSMYYNFSSPVTNSYANIFLANANNSISYTGDGTSGVYLWGAQLETTVTERSSSYIPTTTVSATRNDDVVSVSGANFTSWYNAAQGTFASTFSAAIATASVLTTDVNGLGRPIYVVGGGGVRIFDGTNFAAATGAYTFNAVASAATSYGAAGLVSALNGGTVGTNSFSGSMGTSALYIGGRPSVSEFINGNIKNIRYWPYQVTAAELSAISKG